MTKPRVLKYKIPITDSPIEIVIPMFSNILSFKEQYNEIVMYALVPEDRTISLTKMIFYVFGTGHPTSLDMSKHVFCDTVMTNDGDLVWHVFRRKEWVGLHETIRWGE